MESKKNKKSIENLVPLSKRTKSEQREIAKNGGKRSGEVRRERRAFKDELLALLGSVRDGETRTTNEQISVALIGRALDGDTKAFEIIRDTVGEKPTDKVEHSGAMDMSPPPIRLEIINARGYDVKASDGIRETTEDG